MQDGTIHSAKVLSLVTVQNLYESGQDTPEQIQLFMSFGPQGTMVSTVHGVYPLDKVFLSKEALKESL